MDKYTATALAIATKVILVAFIAVPLQLRYNWTGYIFNFEDVPYLIKNRYG
ncbi:MAG: hypothetical protein RMY64_01045 [Nostoc sp. DedQUE08]|uniref:hypothetical protein n=1 Tax=unclassified Nostoc TaxID=2593658 RepID=UPI002AD318CD|nr:MULTISPECIES: hypothetical protein [unclassified Nostoc]MDZ8032419.1 hypothetical protein [Nostoc sp. DedSLP04]MDZ8064215.1 hypothetical protein [Nostoc sp. DedQUE08]MDZ8090902.1 hypothetical protein [Nostoc sp. DedQUE05]MDZ8134470.1 hypothetical protein [Nostoc sp. DedQUE04]